MKKISAQTQLDPTKIREFPIIKEFGISELKRNLADELLKNVNVESRIGYGGETIISTEFYIADRKEIKRFGYIRCCVINQQMHNKVNKFIKQKNSLLYEKK